MRKIICIFLAIGMLSGLCACRLHDPGVPLFSYEGDGNLPAKIIRENDHWYAIYNTYALADFSFAAGDSFDAMETVYQAPNGGLIRNLTAEGPWCAFYERGVQSLRYVLYNGEDGSMTDMYTAGQISDQNGNMVFVNGCVYFGVIDYENSTAMLKRYDIAAGTLTDFFPLPYAEVDTVQALSRDGDDVLVAVKAAGDQHSQIYRLSTIGGAMQLIDLPANVHTIYSASYDPTQEAYILYYEDGNRHDEHIGIYRREDASLTPVYTFDDGCYAYFDTVECRDGRIYFVLQDNPTGSFTDQYGLMVYHCETGHLQQFPQAYACTLNEKTFHYLRFLGEAAPKVELYEVPYRALAK